MLAELFVVKATPDVLPGKQNAVGNAETKKTTQHYNNYYFELFIIYERCKEK